MFEQTISTIDESIGEQTIEQTICTIDESVREKQCDLWDNSNEHFCTLCGKKVCNIFCSEWDPNSSNEMRRKHKLNDPRCTVINFECPTCDSKFQLQEDLEIHMSSHETSFQMVSLVSEADDSSWKYVACNECDGRFQNEKDLLHHKERVHTYGETCTIYPCEECGFQGTDVLSQKSVQ